MLGLAGAALMFCGDMLYYYTSKPVENLTEEMFTLLAQAGDIRLYAGAILGPVASILYAAGFYHIKLLLEATAPKSGRVIFLAAFSACFFGAVYHALFAAFGFAARYPENTELINRLTLTASIMSAAYMLLTASALIFLIVLTLMKKTPFPRWAVLFNPLVLWWAASVFAYLPNPFYVIFEGGRFNIVFGIFFAVSALTARQRELTA